MTAPLQGAFAFFNFPHTPYVTDRMVHTPDIEAARWFVSTYIRPARDHGIHTVFLREAGRWRSGEPQAFRGPNSNRRHAIDAALREVPPNARPAIVSYEVMPERAGRMKARPLIGDPSVADAWDSSVGADATRSLAIEWLAKHGRTQILEPLDDVAFEDQYPYAKIVAESYFAYPLADQVRVKPLGAASPPVYCWFGRPMYRLPGEDDRAMVRRCYAEFLEVPCRLNGFVPVASLANCIDLRIQLHADGSVRS